MFFYQEPSFIHRMISIIKEANVILRDERTPNMTIMEKRDKNGLASKVTSGDLKANSLIIDKLCELNTSLLNESTGFFNIISEEIAEIPFEKRNSPHVDGTWCVDPLDGTADYCSFEIENPCYTCNIGLIMNGDPVFGIFSVPESGTIYYGIKDVGSFKINDELCLTYADGVEFPGQRLTITKKDLSKSGIRVATSASHLNHETKHFIDQRLNDVNCVCFASSLKFGAVADESVDIYPRCGSTCEWDTCAADAVVRYAGGGTYIYNPGIELEEHREMLKYNKPYLLNPHFIVF